MFDHLRNEDKILFEQLGRIAAYLARAAELLERRLAGPRSAAAGIALEVRALGAQPAIRYDDVDVRAFTGFSMRLDPAQYRELAMALDSAAEAVREATAHVESLGVSAAPEGVRAFAHTLSRAAAALQIAVPFAGEGWDDEGPRSASEVERRADEGEALYIDGVGALFAGAPDPMHVLRWKDVYDKLRHGLWSCARAASVLDQLARANA